MLKNRIKSIFQLRLVILLISMIALCVSLWGLMVAERVHGQQQKLLDELAQFHVGITVEDEAGGELCEILLASLQPQP